MPRKKKPEPPQPQIPVLLPIDACQPTGWNPNVEDLATFNDLIERALFEAASEPVAALTD